MAQENRAPFVMLAGVVVSDYTTLMVEIFRDNARTEAGLVYGDLRGVREEMNADIRRPKPHSSCGLRNRRLKADGVANARPQLV